MPYASFEETRAGALVVTLLEPSLDAHVARALGQAIGERARDRSLVVLSLAHVTTLDCCGIAWLVSVLKRMAPDGELRLLGARPSIRALLSEVHLDRVFPVFDDAAAALAR